MIGKGYESILSRHENDTCTTLVLCFRKVHLPSEDLHSNEKGFKNKARECRDEV